MKSNENKNNPTPKIVATTPPIAPTEPAPIPVDMDNTDVENFERSIKGNGNPDHDITAPKYYCPMHCEGDKMYDAPGNCPVCGMKLVPTDTP